MSQLVTRCPHCSTSFHVSEQQLRAARGAVRCGSCLQVFRADENIVFNEDDPQPATKKAIDELLDDDDFLIHDDIELEGEDNSADDNELPPQGKRPLPPATTQVASEPRQQPLIDDAFGEHQWQELGDEDASDSGLLIGDELESAGDTLWAEEMAQEAPLAQPTAKAKQAPPVQDDWEQGLGDELAAEHPLPGEAQEETLLTGAELSPIPDENAPDSGNNDHFDVSQRHDAPLLERDQLISGIGPAPLEVNWQPKRHHRIPTWLWGLAALMLLLALVAQTAYFRFDSLSKREPWRQLYATACPVIGCTLPPQVDVRAIHTSNLVVRSHPQIAGALAVEAVLLNRAPFAQPFPELVLRFTDLKNAPIASRRFKPADYLKGELAGRRLMPSGNPVHIALDIVDPGTEAVNYELLIAPR